MKRRIDEVVEIMVDEFAKSLIIQHFSKHGAKPRSEEDLEGMLEGAREGARESGQYEAMRAVLMLFQKGL